MQSLIDQKRVRQRPLKGYGHTNYGPVPSQPKNPYSDAYETKGPWPYSTRRRPSACCQVQRLEVKPNGVSTCTTPGTGQGQCGAGIKARHAAELHPQVRQRRRW